MKEFIIIGHKAATAPFSLNDLPGAAGRIDILCRCVNAALFLSHDLRRDVRVYLVLKGGSPSKLISFDGARVRYLNPDERSAASLIKRALEKNAQDFWIESTPGVSIRKGDFGDLLAELKTPYFKTPYLNTGTTGTYRIIYLRQEGEDIRGKKFDRLFDELIFVLGDHMGFTDNEEKIIEGYDHEKVSVGPLSLHADHCIVLLHNEMDRRDCRKRT
jgi:tRNA (pseudouridine54-N1)-methyltransferase